ncbi:MAG: hypothetical protein ACFE0I_18450 [Elainellaceae cyanobacterium]
MRLDADQFNPVNYDVVFKESVTDQALLGAIERALATQPYASFSDLCKQALRQSLLGAEMSSTMPLFLELQRQIVDLRVSLANLEYRLRGDRPTPRQENLDHPFDHLDHQFTRLSSRLGETRSTIPFNPRESRESPEPERVPATISRASDPLLDRLAPILDDF